MRLQLKLATLGRQDGRTMVRAGVVAEILAAAAVTAPMQFRSATILRDGRAVVARTDTFAEGRSVSTIVKRFKAGYHEHFPRERAGLRLLSNVEGDVVPALIGENEAELTLVLQDVSDGLSLDTIVATSDATAATRALVAVAAGLGAIHARGRLLQPAHALPPTSTPGDVLIRCMPDVLRFIERVCGTAATPPARHALFELAAQADILQDYATFTFGDLAPSNVLLVDGAPVFLDLEYCGCRHPFYDAVFWRCICPMPNAVRTAMDAAYLRGARTAGAELTQAKFEHDMLLFAAHRTLWTLSWNMDPVFIADREFVPGVSTRAVLRRYLNECLILSKRHDALSPTWIGLLVSLADHLSNLWPEADPGFELPCFSEVRDFL
jgi:hypothetical protein